MRKIFTFTSMLIIVLLLSACSGGEFKAKYKLEIEPFAFTNQHNEEVTLEDLKGEVWLAQFVFSNCTTACGPMMVNMAELQDKLVDEGVEAYKIVSFSVDPDFDTPEVLQGYLDVFNPSDASKWEMLTGYKKEKIAEMARKSFATLVVDEPGTDQVTHGTSFVLVNQEGIVVKLYAGLDDVPYDEIVTDMKALIKQGA